MNSGEKEVRYQEKRSAWCGVQGGPGECRWWWRSAEWNWGAQIQAKEHQRELRSVYAAEQPIQPEQHWKGREVKSQEWTRGALNWDWGGDWEAPIPEEERGQQMQYGALNIISKN